jgi:uncharacterized protein YbgA (DUF1722 family)/uncharacterized protein YbbK (DUF523 family)
VTKKSVSKTRPDKSGRSEIRIGISACLLGTRVRYDGEHKLDRFIRDTVGQFVTFVAVCPEVDIGLGVPRETIRLVGQGSDPRLVGSTSGADHTTKMRRYAKRKAQELGRQEISGYILKKNSPSCGMERVKIYDGKGSPSRGGRGVFAGGLMDSQPLLPVEEEGRLNDPKLRENFFERVFAYRRMRDCLSRRWTLGDIVAFHTAEKFLVLAHDPKAYASLGRLVARAKSLPRADLSRRYQEGFMTALAKSASRGRHGNVLQHMMGYFKRQLSADEKAELQQVITDFRHGFVPLIVPITLIRHYVRLFDGEYLAGQTYLEPHPKELMLRNHV